MTSSFTSWVNAATMSSCMAFLQGWIAGHAITLQEMNQGFRGATFAITLPCKEEQNKALIFSRGGPITIDVCEPGELFGVACLMELREHSLTAVCLEDSHKCTPCQALPMSPIVLCCLSSLVKGLEDIKNGLNLTTKLIKLFRVKGLGPIA